MEDNLALILKYPLISVKSSKGKQRFSGFLTMKNCDFPLEIVVEDGKYIIENPPLAEFSAQSGNIVDFLDAVTTTLEAPKMPQNYVNAYRTVLHEYCELTKFHFGLKKCRLAPDLSLVTVAMTDEGGHCHSLQIAVDLCDGPHYFHPLTPDLPEKICAEFMTKSGSLLEIYDKFAANVNCLQDFFNVMANIDANCVILDPEKPAKRDCYRRIWLGDNLSVVVTLDPTNITTRPDLKFLGPERQILSFRHKLNENLAKWGEWGGDFLTNLLGILELTAFPLKLAPELNSRTNLMEIGECSICFSARLNNKLPEVICANKSCENFYHVECLYQWLTSVDSKHIFNQLHGTCPNCEKGISCPLPE